jgi:hypothetical protein
MPSITKAEEKRREAGKRRVMRDDERMDPRLGARGTEEKD